MNGDHAISAYLDQVAATLPGAPRARRDVLAELRSGLLDATDAHRRAGLPADAAAETAIAEFGDPRQIAAAFRPELTITHARRVAFTLMATGPVTALLWSVTALGSHFGFRLAPPWQWAGLTPGAHLAVHLAAAAFVLTALTSLVTVAATGRLTRWLPSRPRAVSATAAIAGFSTAAANLAIFALLTSQILSAPSTIDPTPVTIAAAGSLTHLSLARRVPSQARREALRPRRPHLTASGPPPDMPLLLATRIVRYSASRRRSGPGIPSPARAGG
jgi:hypothetical protein